MQPTCGPAVTPTAVTAPFPSFSPVLSCPVLSYAVLSASLSERFQGLQLNCHNHSLSVPSLSYLCRLPNRLILILASFIPSLSLPLPLPPSLSPVLPLQFLAAARQIENLMCTSRESLLGSGAWRPEFLAALKSRPFYFVTEVTRRDERG